MVGHSASAGSSGEARIRPVADLFGAFALEIQELATCASELQDAIGAAGPAVRTDPAFQSLDLITQRLAGLGGFIAILTASIPQEWLLDCTKALGSITLGKLSDRLGGVTDRPDIEVAGDLDLF